MKKFPGPVFDRMNLRVWGVSARDYQATGRSWALVSYDGSKINEIPAIRHDGEDMWVDVDKISIEPMLLRSPTKMKVMYDFKRKKRR